MIVSIDKFQNGISKYFEEEIASKATGFKKFASYFVMTAYEKKLPEIIHSLEKNEAIKVLEIFTPDDNIDVDKLYNYAKEAYKHSGQFVLSGIIFNESDIDKLYNCLM